MTTQRQTQPDGATVPEHDAQAEAPDPLSVEGRIKAFQRALAGPEMPRRFYKLATAEPLSDADERAGIHQDLQPADTALYRVLLDGRPVRTPGRALLVLPGGGAAQAIADEWLAQGERIDARAMDFTRLANTAIDRVAGRRGEVIDEIVSYARSDLLCYRAQSPDSLVAAQDAAWTPVLDWVGESLGAHFVTVAGVMFVEQSETAAERVAQALHARDCWALTALHNITTLTGSALIALALAHRHLSPDEAWGAAHVDEDWQWARWGIDLEAEARRAGRRAAFDAAWAFHEVTQSAR